MARVFVVVIFVAFVSSLVSGAPQEAANTTAPGLPSTGEVDPQVLQDCLKQKEACESRVTEGNSNAGPVTSSQLGTVVKPIQDGVSQIKVCERNFELCEQQAKLSTTTPAPAAAPRGMF